jgi:uncharacterized protein (TIGR02996 family)
MAGSGALKTDGNSRAKADSDLTIAGHWASVKRPVIMKRSAPNVFSDMGEGGTMWLATTFDEANFIFDIQTDRQSHATVLVYADWLEERGENLPAEFLRQFVSANKNEEQLQSLRPKLDPRWLAAVTRHWYREGDVVKILDGYFEVHEGTIAAVDVCNALADVIPHLFVRRSEPMWVRFADLEIPSFASSRDGTLDP